MQCNLELKINEFKISPKLVDNVAILFLSPKARGLAIVFNGARKRGTSRKWKQALTLLFKFFA